MLPLRKVVLVLVVFLFGFSLLHQQTSVGKI
jgi:hypothetical protein